METAEFWQKRNDEIDADVASAQAYARSDEGRREALTKELIYTHTNTEAGKAEFERLSAELAALEAKMKAESDARFAAVWTREVTIARRAEWNAFATSKEFTKVPQSEKLRTVAAREKAQGWSTGSLKAAIALHNL